ncbi:DNA polymerase kappa [Phytophthora cinnamomi]|uniref:DNA polymerase kappa n=1 Tax=Phytophthora cinnamomi TaxID=4785 RepID=UPI00355A8A31|nr:DNA polymerase kappa [Phytophthora cinnamomi]
MFVFTADKAGMKGVDKQHVQEVVHKMSKDSSFYQKSLRDNEKVGQRVAAMREKLACLTGGQQLRLQQEADVQVAQMEAARDLSRTIVVVDMDMFYAAVEMRDDPKLRDVPLAVGGMNMISTTNYAARQYGVRAAMPGFIGKELCPELHFVPVNMEKYAGVAAQYASVAGDDIESKGHDDEMQWATTPDGRAAIAAVVVRELRQKIFDCTQLTASAGIAVNSMLAKICSDMNKPNGHNMEVNAHMDACVVSKKPMSSSSPLRHPTRKKSKQSGITQVFTTVQESDKVDEDTKPCPICGKLLNARSNMEVNAHMDACVSRDRSPSSRKVSGKKRGPNEISTARRKPENSIDVFFRKNYND